MLCHRLHGAVGTTLPAPRLISLCNYLYSCAVSISLTVPGHNRYSRASTERNHRKQFVGLAAPMR